MTVEKNTWPLATTVASTIHEMNPNPIPIELTQTNGIFVLYI
jgi:hypothetical protein